MLALKSKNKEIVFLVFLAALIVRIYQLNIPFVEPYNNISRQSMCASVARNFYQRGFHLLYPEVDEGGAGPYLYNVEMPIYSYVMAWCYWFLGGVREWVARSVSVFSSMVALIFLYRLFSLFFSEKLTLMAVIFFSFSPLCVALSRSIQPDMTMLAAGTGALYYFCRYQMTQKRRYYAGSLILMMLAVATRAFALYLFIPIFFIAWHTQGRRLFKDPWNYLYVALVSSVLLWYLYMWYLGTLYELPYQPYQFERGSMRQHHSYLRLFCFPALALPLKVFFAHILTPLGTYLFLMGVFQRPNKKYLFIYVWSFSVLIYLLAAWPTAVYHPYYLLPLVPVLSFFVGLGFERALANPSLINRARRPIFAAVIIVGELLSLFYFYRLLYFIPRERWSIVDAGKAVDQIVPKESLIIASWGASPIQLYYCNRRGWAFDLYREDDHRLIEELEKCKRQGAGWFVTSTPQQLKKLHHFDDYLRQNYSVVKETDQYILFHLANTP